MIKISPARNEVSKAVFLLLKKNKFVNLSDLIKEIEHFEPVTVKQNCAYGLPWLKKFIVKTYVDIAKWIQVKNLTLFRVGQFVIWMLHIAKHHLVKTAVGLILFFILLVLPLLNSMFYSYSFMLWSVAGLLVFVVLSMMGVSFGNKKMKEFAEKEFRLMQKLKSQLEGDFQSQLKEFSERVDILSEKQEEQTAFLEALRRQGETNSENQHALNTLLDDLLKKNEEQVGVTDALRRLSETSFKNLQTLSTSQENQVEQLARIERETKRFTATAPVFNFCEFQRFNRTLNKTQVKILQTEWMKKLNLKIHPKQISYLAHKICILESHSRGRLATTIEDIVLRGLIVASVKSTDLRVLEIGTLFGIGICAIDRIARSHFSSIHFTAIDPLDGYYGGGVLDMTGEPVNEQIFHDNLKVAGLTVSDYSLIKLLSTEDIAIESAMKQMYDVLIIDGDHSLAGVKADFINYLPAVKRGGYIIFDDYNVSDRPDVKEFVDSTVKVHPELAFVGASWRTAAFRVVSKSTQETHVAPAT